METRRENSKSISNLWLKIREKKKHFWGVYVLNTLSKAFLKTKIVKDVSFPYYITLCQRQR